ncbi:MAG: ABC transporter ATP-binding protein [Lachnospiraceae bacterium]|jgi:putative ABC transport system ATP-binding protein|nr:ABC transporter ATP-binding protein [Lachnospiraceae bacterium]
MEKNVMSELEYIVEARGISRTYQGEVPVYALKKADIVFRKGEFTAIFGRSGSGKSTLLRILATLDVSDTGELYIEGKNVSALKDAELAHFRRRRIGFIYQDFNLFPEYTAYENIVFPIHLDGREEDRASIEKLMDDLGILHCRDKFPHEMSGGEQQRISIARALATEPAVILADEPTGNLDAENSQKVAELLRFCSEEYGRTVVMVTHDKSMADYADRIISISDGVVTV